MTPNTNNPSSYIEEPRGPREISPVPTSITAFVGRARRGPVDEPSPIGTFEEFKETFGGLSRSSPMSYAVQHFFLNGGRSALIVRVRARGRALTDSDIVGNRPTRTGMYALEKADLFNLLCIPPLDFTRDPDPREALAPALEYCRERRAILIVDPPLDWVTKEDAKTNIDSFIPRDPNAAVYFPRLRAPDPLQKNRLDVFVPCGAVCGVMARTDAERGMWKPPAGISATVAGVSELTCELTDLELSELNSVALNCLRTVPVAGPVVWGARTLEGADSLASEWKYVPVRRLALFIEESIRRGTQWAVFEPNDEAVWLQIRVAIGAFMLGLFRQGALQGRTVADAYFVKCDSTTTTQNDIESGFINIEVGFAPLKPAEFVILRIRHRMAES